MSANPETGHSPLASVAAAAVPYVAGAAVFSIAVSLYNGTGDSGIDFNSKRVLAIAIAGAAAAGVGVLLLVFAWLRSAANRKSGFWLPLIANAIVATACFGALDVALRILAQPDPLGVRIGGTVLIPYDWKRVAESNMALYERSLRPSAYYVGDKEVGWAIGAGRKSEDGLYASSVEGLRSSRQGQNYEDQEFEYRVALFGDSFVFSEEVNYADSLSKQLEDRLGAGVQILNFGVPGYGVDQAVMRFQRARKRWQPDLVVLGFVQDDLLRAANVYTFLKIGWGIPFSKPRYLLDDASGALRLINSPNMEPAEMYAKDSIFDLPHLDADIAFFGHSWRQSALNSSYLFRYAVSVVPRWPEEAGPISSEAVDSVGVRLIQSFAEDAVADGATQLVVYFPSRGDFSGQSREQKTRVISRLAAADVETINLADCGESSIDSIDLFVVDGVHYSGAGNSLVAECLVPYVHEALSK